MVSFLSACMYKAFAMRFVVASSPLGLVLGFPLLDYSETAVDDMNPALPII